MRKGAALLLSLLILPFAPSPDAGGIQITKFGGGTAEITIEFPPGGGTNSSVNITLPAGATVLSATMDLAGVPQVLKGRLDCSTPERLRRAATGVNLTFNDSGASLAPLNWSWLQSSDAQFWTDERQNISIGDGARISDEITGGKVRTFTAVSGVELEGMPSVGCTPEGEFLVAWLEKDPTSMYDWYACLQRFDADGIAHWPEARKFAERAFNISKPRAASDSSGNAVLVWDYWAASGMGVHKICVAVFDKGGNELLAFDAIQGSTGVLPFLGSAAVTGQDEMLVSWAYTMGVHRVSGRWFRLNGTPVGEEFQIDDNFPSLYYTGIVSVGNDRSIAHASFEDSAGNHTRAYLVRVDPSGSEAHPKLSVGGNDSYTTPTSFAILDDNSAVVAFTADYPGRNLSVRCARVLANGTVAGEFPLREKGGTYFNPSLCRLPGNRFACAWGVKGEGLEIGLEGRVFKADGTPEGDLFSLGTAYGWNSSWELCARGNSSLALVVRSEEPPPHGEIRVAVVDLERARDGRIDSPVLDRPGNVRAEVELAARTAYSVDVVDAATREAIQSGLHNGDPVRTWEPYILRLNLHRDAFSTDADGPVARVFGVATAIRDSFTDGYLISEYQGGIYIGNGRVTRDPFYGPSGCFTSTGVQLPYRARSLDNFSWEGGAGNGTVSLSLRGLRSGTWSEWENLTNPDFTLATPPGDAVQWGAEFSGGAGEQPYMDSVELDYSLLYRTGFLLSAPVSLQEGTFRGFRVNWTAGGGVTALVTTDGGMSFTGCPNGQWTEAPGGQVLQAMLVLEGDGNSSPQLFGFSVEHEATHFPSDLELEMDGSWRWSPPAGSDLEKGIAVRDFSTVLNDMLSRAGGAGDVTVPLNITSASRGLLVVRNLQIRLNFPPAIEESSPSGEVVMEENATRRFSLRVSDSDGDPLLIAWLLDGETAGHGLTFDLAAPPGSAGNHSLEARVSDGHASASRTWRVRIVGIDHNLPPRILGRLPPYDPVINESETVQFSVEALDPEGSPLRHGWYLDGEKLSVSDNLTYRSWYDSAGTYNVTATVSDGARLVSTRWTLVVLDRDRPPVIDRWSPGSAPNFRPGQPLEFSINASDPDNDTLTYSWYVDGEPVPEAASPDLTFSFADEGTHRVRAVVSDSNLTASHEWELRAASPPAPASVGIPLCPLAALLAAAAFLSYLGIRYGKKSRAK